MTHTLKTKLFATTIVACLAIALAAPVASPAGSSKKGGSGKTSNQTPPPKKGTKTPPPKKAPPPPPAATPAPPAPPSGLGNLSVRAPALMNTNRVRMMLREPGANQVAEQDVCLFQNANFTGWKYCSNLKGLQELPGRYQGQATSMTVPDGYLVRLYQRADRSGTQCIFYGQVGQVARDCDNMTAAISFEADPEWPAKQAAAQRQRELQEAEDARQAQKREREEDAARATAIEQQRQAQAEAERQQVNNEERRRYEEERRERVRQEALEREAAARERDWRDAVLGAPEGCLALLVDQQAFTKETICVNQQNVSRLSSGMNDDINNIFFQNNRLQITVYEHADFQGRSLKLQCGAYYLKGDPENKISSFKAELLPSAVRCSYDGTTISTWGQ
jgi:hypothetical protein